MWWLVQEPHNNLLGSDGGTRLVLLVLAGVREAGDDGSDALGGSGLARGNHDEELHEVVVDIRGRGRLEDEDVLVTDRLVDLDRGLKREELGDMAGGKLDTEAVG
jgi:hypothetical protein